MASWQDGAEYAPLERPDGFATPVVDPIEQIAPVRSGTLGPTPPPDSYTAVTDAVPLDKLTVQAARHRDPQQPFAVTAAAITAESSWDATGAVGNSPGVTNFDPTMPMSQYLEPQPATFPPPSLDPYHQAAPGQTPHGYPMPVPGALNSQMTNQYAAPRTQQLSPARIQLLWVSAVLIALGWYLPEQATWFLAFGGVTASLAHKKFAMVVFGAIAFNVITGIGVAPYSALQVRSITCILLASSAASLAIFLRKQGGSTPPPRPGQ